MMSEVDAEGRKGRPILRICIISAVVLIVLISTTVFFYNFNGKSLDFSDSEILVIPTGSMDGEPQDYHISTIPVDSIIMVHHLSQEQKENLEIGDVITFHQDGIYKVHRIVQVNDDGTLVTKGDANQFPDPAIQLSDVTGKVVGVAPNVGKVVSFLRDITFGSPILLFIGIALLILLVYSIIELVRIVRDKDEKE